ncbi:hypothetical protein BMH32_09590 [Leucobacter sp. OLJS4]|uniref:hypothetical protein n=1 Tax=unclassified Leucobacter TaxID=2621730 RepID=UPI000C1A1656|nr:MULTISPECIES: hypothetical protein [unclassified Leucobacter]PIJ41511.1 hypothetical protein BMH30_08665 [Leucobacter sp. OLES1]PII83818.1 hypothetical protein BMH25_06875 [Leucobacter sp. OLCALW19]PII89351.1 hypothetical protein BMH26_03915 [Leucobacter sp. OLTLW20]PII90652.1 hypothetical protein BMH27_09845 [Leucobacter sp. OLAS13]PII98355.1 hypothetical protein BMH28_12925 [Leucobacter sp. OLCS4]
MSEMQQASGGEVALSTQALVPSIQRFGEKDIEVTFLGNNADGQPTWILWNRNEPYLIGVLRQGKLGFTFEQRTDHGVLLHQDISFSRLQRAIAG